MARYFQGNTLASFTRNSLGIIENTTAGQFDSTLVPNCLVIANSSGGSIYAEARLNANASGNVWLHFEHFSNVPVTNNGGWVTLVNSAGVPVFRLFGTGTNTMQPQVWSGSAWVATGSSFTPVATLNRFDLRFTPGNGGSFDFYSAGTLVSSGTGHSVTGVTADVRTVRLGSYATSGSTYAFSQVLCGDFDTRDSRYRQATINANGALTDGTGGFADIAETVLDETTSIKLTTAAQRKSFTKAAITVPGGYRIGSVGISVRSRVTGTLTNVKALLRLSTTNYTSANLGPNAGYEPRFNIWETNPATSANWTQTDFNNAEVGVEAV